MHRTDEAVGDTARVGTSLSERTERIGRALVVFMMVLLLAAAVALQLLAEG